MSQWRHTHTHTYRYDVSLCPVLSLLQTHNRRGAHSTLLAPAQAGKDNGDRKHLE